MKDWSSKLNYINRWLLKRYRQIMTSGGDAGNEVVDMYTIGNTKSSTTEVPGSSDDSDVPGSSDNSDSNDEDREK